MKTMMLTIKLTMVMNMINTMMMMMAIQLAWWRRWQTPHDRHPRHHGYHHEHRHHHHHHHLHLHVNLTIIHHHHHQNHAGCECLHQYWPSECPLPRSSWPSKNIDTSITSTTTWSPSAPAHKSLSSSQTKHRYNHLHIENARETGSTIVIMNTTTRMMMTAMTMLAMTVSPSSLQSSSSSEPSSSTSLSWCRLSDFDLPLLPLPRGIVMTVVLNVLAFSCCKYYQQYAVHLLVGHYVLAYAASSSSPWCST